MKKILQTDIVGQQGINLIESECLKMGFLWHPTGLEAGIDGYIEIRNASTGEVTNCIIQVQSKATEQPFEGETESKFEYRCSEKDLEYWLAGNAPVILIRSRPKTNEAYWVSLKDRFKDLSVRKLRKVVFDKTADRFDQGAKANLERLAIPTDAGLYLGTKPKEEVVYSNLVKLAPFPEHYSVARTDYRTRPEAFAALREVTTNVRGDWILGNRMITSFHDLSTRPWTEVCDSGTVEELDTEEWAQTKDPGRQRDFVQLLNSCLREKLFPKGIKFSKENEFYYFRATRDLTDREYAYQSRENRTDRWVFKGYPKKSDPSKMSYYRHSAFDGRFVRYGSEWFLQVTPNYHFTRDGERTSWYAANLLSGIKRLENNQAVHGQVVMWANVLTERSLFDFTPQFLDFISPLQFQLDVGLEDKTWLKREESEKRAALEAPAPDERQQRFDI
jgi:hypothetical protein